MKFEVFSEYIPYANRVEFYVFSIDPDGRRNICTSIDKMEFSPYEEGKTLSPTFSLSGYVTNPFLQAMANMLDKSGIRAEGKPILENELTATKYHLEDMRSLVFKVEKEK